MTMKTLAQRPEARYPPDNAISRLPLTFKVGPLWFAQPLESPSGQMRNKITSILILVVPRRTAGAG
jgi:hypothetical protein